MVFALFILTFGLCIVTIFGGGYHHDYKQEQCPLGYSASSQCPNHNNEAKGCYSNSDCPARMFCNSRYHTCDPCYQCSPRHGDTPQGRCGRYALCMQTFGTQPLYCEHLTKSNPQCNVTCSYKKDVVGKTCCLKCPGDASIHMIECIQYHPVSSGYASLTGHPCWIPSPCSWPAGIDPPSNPNCPFFTPRTPRPTPSAETTLPPNNGEVMQEPAYQINIRDVVLTIMLSMIIVAAILCAANKCKRRIRTPCKQILGVAENTNHIEQDRRGGEEEILIGETELQRVQVPAVSCVIVKQDTAENNTAEDPTAEDPTAKYHTAKGHTAKDHAATAFAESSSTHEANSCASDCQHCSAKTTSTTTEKRRGPVEDSTDSSNETINFGAIEHSGSFSSSGFVEGREPQESSVSYTPRDGRYTWGSGDHRFNLCPTRSDTEDVGDSSTYVKVPHRYSSASSVHRSSEDTNPALHLIAQDAMLDRRNPVVDEEAGGSESEDNEDNEGNTTHKHVVPLAGENDDGTSEIDGNVNLDLREDDYSYYN